MSSCLGTPRPPATSTPRTGPVGFNHAKCPPAPALVPFVDHYWVTRWDRHCQPARAAASLLDPCVHLQVRDGRAEVTGLLRGAYRVSIEGTGCVVGVKFRPGGLYPFVRRPVRAWTDCTMSATRVFEAADDRWARALWDAVLGCGGDAAAHVAIISTPLDELLGAQLPARDAVAKSAADLVALIETSGDLRGVVDLVRASGRSERTLDRLCERYVGASPAWVIRRFRRQAAARRLTATPPADVRAIAWELGYADQAHFIRDFRATIGVTPGAYVQTGA